MNRNEIFLHFLISHNLMILFDTMNDKPEFDEKFFWLLMIILER